MPLRDAATIALLRDGERGVEVFLMRRQRSMAFAAGMHVYPGGAVEPGDTHVPLAGSSDLEAVGRRLSTPDPVGILAAAARETFEECGVLLAVGVGGAPVALDASYDVQREELAAGRLPFADLLAARALRVDAEALVPFAHWVTPEIEERRYDTRFLAARLPEGQEATERGGEADRVAWWRPSDALASYAAGETAMLPPTVATLQQIAPDASVDDALAALRLATVLPLMPHPFPDGDDLVWHLVDERTREIVGSVGEPSASETDGVGR